MQETVRKLARQHTFITILINNLSFIRIKALKISEIKKNKIIQETQMNILL